MRTNGLPIATCNLKIWLIITITARLVARLVENIVKFSNTTPATINVSMTGKREGKPIQAPTQKGECAYAFQDAPWHNPCCMSA